MAYWGDTARAGRARAPLPRVAPPSPRDASVAPELRDYGIPRGARRPPHAPKWAESQADCESACRCSHLAGAGRAREGQPRRRPSTRGRGVRHRRGGRGPSLPINSWRAAPARARRSRPPRAADAPPPAGRSAEPTAPTRRPGPRNQRRPRHSHREEPPSRRWSAARRPASTRRRR